LYPTILQVAKSSLMDERTISPDPSYNKSASPRKNVKPKYSVMRDTSVGKGTRLYHQIKLYKCEIGEKCKVDAYVYIE